MTTSIIQIWNSRVYNLFTLLVSAVVLATAAAHLAPASIWMSVQRINAGPGHTWEPIPMIVSRKINLSFVARWTVTVRRWENGVWYDQCSHTDVSHYTPDSQLPEALTLEWWTRGSCNTLPQGRYYLTTHWKIEPSFDMLPTKQVQVDSNIFEVSAR